MINAATTHFCILLRSTCTSWSSSAWLRKCELQGVGSLSRGCLACQVLFCFSPHRWAGLRMDLWPARFWYDGKFCPLTFRWPCINPDNFQYHLCTGGCFFKINSQIIIQGEMNSIHNIFSNDYLWGPCLDSSSIFFPCRCLVLYCSIYILCFIVFYRCWGSAENGRRFSSPHGPQYGDRSDPCSGKLCSFCWSWKWQNIKKTVER